MWIVAGYLIGSLSFAVIVSKLFGLPDPRTFGSNNPGATNVLRTGKKAAAVLTLLGDAAKGYVAVALAQHYGVPQGLPEWGVAGVALTAFLGHIYPLFFGFHGGKGVATALGILLALSPWVGLGALGTWLLAAYMWRISSLSALIAAGFAPVYATTVFGFSMMTGAVALLSALLVWRHKENIGRLLRGEEKAFGKKKPERKFDLPPG